MSLSHLSSFTSEEQRYVRLAVKLTELTLRGEVTWTKVSEGASYHASHNGWDFKLYITGTYNSKGKESAADWAESLRLRHLGMERRAGEYRLYANSSDGDMMVFPPSSAVDNLGALVARKSHKQLDKLERALNG